MPMPSQASGAAAHFFAIGKAMRRQVSSQAPPRLAEPQRNVNSHIHATSGPHTRPPPRPQPLGSHRRAAPDSQPPGEDEPTAACPDPRAQGSGPAADRPSLSVRRPLPSVRRPSPSVRRPSPPPLAAVRRSASPSGAQDHAIFLAFSNSVSTADFRFNASRSAALGPDFKPPIPDRPAFNDNGSDGCRPLGASRMFTSFDFRGAGGSAARPSTTRLCPEPGVPAAAANACRGRPCERAGSLANRGRRRGPARTSKTPVAPISNVIPAATMARPNERSLASPAACRWTASGWLSAASPPGCGGSTPDRRPSDRLPSDRLPQLPHDHRAGIHPTTARAGGLRLRRSHLGPSRQRRAVRIQRSPRVQCRIGSPRVSMRAVASSDYGFPIRPGRKRVDRDSYTVRSALSRRPGRRTEMCFFGSTLTGQPV